MKPGLRLISLLAGGITLVVVLVVWSEIRAGQFALQVELQHRAATAADRLRDGVEPMLRSQSVKRLQAVVERLVTRERLGGAAVYDAQSMPLAVSATIGEALNGQSAFVECGGQTQPCGEFVTLGTWPLYVYSAPLHVDLPAAGVLAVFLDASAVTASSAHAWRNALFFIAPQVVVIVFVVEEWGEEVTGRAKGDR